MSQILQYCSYSSPRCNLEFPRLLPPISATVATPQIATDWTFQISTPRQFSTTTPQYCASWLSSNLLSFRPTGYKSKIVILACIISQNNHRSLNQLILTYCIVSTRSHGEKRRKDTKRQSVHGRSWVKRTTSSIHDLLEVE
jgi:hypothetical protein